MKSQSEWDATCAAAQQDSGFRAWLEMMEFQVEEFLTFDAPSDVPDDPYTPEDLRVAERGVLEAFATSEDFFRDEDSRTHFDRYARFLGECFVQKLGGTWIDMPKTGKSEAFLGLKLPTSDIPLAPYQLINVAVKHRHGNVWAPILLYAEEDARDGVHRTGLPR